MSSERSITIKLYNRTDYTLTNYDCSATSGSSPTPSGYAMSNGQTHVDISVAPGASLTVEAKNNSGSCAGQFTLSDGSHVSFPVTYSNPSSGDPSLGVQTPPGYPGCQGWNDSDSYSGNDIDATIDLYDGAGVYTPEANGTDTLRGYVVPLASDPYGQKNNCQDYVNAMFQPALRGATFEGRFNQGSTAPYMPVDFSGQYLASDNTGNLVAALAGALKRCWPGQSGVAVETSSPDYPIVEFLADFLVVPDSHDSTKPDTSKAPCIMYVPQFTYVSATSEGPKYQLTGYASYPFNAGSTTRFNMDSVDTFLQLLLAGAHFVNVQADSDYDNQKSSPKNNSRDLYNRFKDNIPGSLQHRCIGNSHYTNTVNTSGLYYGNTYGEWAAPGSGLVQALLFAKTADTEWNTFMQLEGWPADGDWVTGNGSWTGGPRHGADYANYQTSYWNISTFGACPYSEKRATTIFLSTAHWTPAICSSTYMMPYVGAETLQHWLKTGLVSVPSGTPSKPSTQ
ncbi:MAG: hypothetical protein WDM91_14060 [Rhizomicrobium sp.]